VHLCSEPDGALFSRPLNPSPRRIFERNRCDRKAAESTKDTKECSGIIEVRSEARARQFCKQDEEATHSMGGHAAATNRVVRARPTGAGKSLPMPIRPLIDLVNTREPGMALVHEWAAAATNVVEILPCKSSTGEATLLALQTTTRSPMGAIAYETGGILIDHGWLRILGAGCPKLRRGLSSWNRIGKEHAAAPSRLPGAFLVADDAVGGFFALNGGGLVGSLGNVFYFAPDTLTWEDLELGYSEWLQWAFASDLTKFFENARWPGWQSEIADLRADQAISIYPYLFTAGPSVAERSRKPVPVRELWSLYVVEFPRALATAVNLSH
jgi:hypothetical protein